MTVLQTFIAINLLSTVTAFLFPHLVFQRTEYVWDISENSASGSTVGRVVAKGCESNERIVYSLTPNPMFLIEATTGIIRIFSALDREVQDVYVFKVFAACSSSHGNGNHTSTTVTIHVIDVNDNAPIFTQHTYHASMDRNAPIGKHILQVIATDDDLGDNSRIHYAIAGQQPSHRLEIDTLSGWILLNSRLDPDSDSLTAVVLAIDGGVPPYSSTATVQIHVTGTATASTPVFDKTVYTFNFLEDAAINTFIGKVHAVSKEGISSYILDGDNGFTIDNNGSIFTTAIFDREVQSMHSFNVTAIDMHNQTTTARVFIHILDINDNAPRFPYTSIIFHLHPLIKSGDLLGSVVAIDDDGGLNAKLTYSIQPSNDFLAVDSNTGMMRFHGNYSSLTQNVYHFSASVSDGFLTSSVPVLLYRV